MTYNALASVPRNPLTRAAAAIWTDLPVQLLLGTAAAAAWSLARYSVLFTFIALLIVVPILGLQLAVFTASYDGRAVRLSATLALLPRAALSAWLLSGPGVAAFALTVAAFQIFAVSGQSWMLLSGGAGLAVTVVLTAIGLMAVPPTLAGKQPRRSAWADAFIQFVSRPASGLATVSVFGLAGWASSVLAFPLLILLSLPLVALWHATTRPLTN
ncbi:hypothetical protein PlfCFBP13513_15650 [Plantibacter flavus]|uniref:hypothetical protein n=1 Tax=Plantibacter TaxID=190323 RepID=UPI0010C2340A|nr:MULTISPECIES: hypothetical protein [Plantibacter]MBD8103932.1 hypothetical protein [Plantibacter sp. CFBP 8775]MBD8467380.1 hypothetical protein [Plantibacter sp. CFBP 8798]MBD8534554.1 hypothetical protein [Plantibacter sp. CFBP 13570]TKJ96844.1 hypothetical protein PlfCFBP13513_15650 [Plantibacter flavus]